jgi:hypothetical protein
MRFKTFISEQTRKPEHTHAVTRGGNVISYHTSSKSAHKKADSLDNKYGATVHSVKLLESAISEMIPYALSAANANAEHARQRKAKEEEKRKAKEQLDKDSEDNSNPFANVKESNVKVGQRVKFNEPVAGTARHTRKPMSFDGGKVVQVTPTHAIVRPQAWHGDEGLDVHVPHKNIKEAIVEGGNYGKPYNNDEDLNSKSNTELQSLHKFWTTRIEKDPNHSRAKDQLTKIKAILASKIGKKTNEEVELDEGMLDDYIEGKIAKHHANKHNPEINAAHADAAEVTKKIKPFNKKIAQIKKRVSYKDKTHKNYAKTRADLKDASAAIQPLNAERSKHYDRIRDARNKRDSNTDSDVETYHKWGVVGLGAKKLKQKLTKEEVELDEEMNNRITMIRVRGQNVIVHRYDTEAKGEYKEVKHHSSATAAQTYARQLHKARGRDAELVIKEAKDEGEYDYEGDMAMSQLKSVIANAQKLHDMLKPDTNLPEWVQSKITLAEDYIVTATNYMDGELNEGLVSAIKRAFTPKPKTPDEAIADFRKKTKERTQQNLGPAARRKPKEYTARLPDSGRKPESRSEYTANREMTKENYAIAAKQSQSFKTFRGGIKGKGTGTRRTHTNQVADHVKIYKESTND